MFCASTLHAQYIDTITVPVAVRNKLKRMYPDAKSVNWVYDCISQSVTRYGKDVERFLCFQVSFPYKQGYEILHFDSTGTWYLDWESAVAPPIPFVPPAQARNKIIGIHPKATDISWGYYTEKYIKNGDYAAYFKDSLNEYISCFDSTWRYLGSSFDMEDSSSLPIHSINKYIKKNLKRPRFVFARAVMDPDEKIVSVEVYVEIKEGKYNRCILEFDKNGNLVGKPLKQHISPPDF